MGDPMFYRVKENIFLRAYFQLKKRIRCCLPAENSILYILLRSNVYLDIFIRQGPEGWIILNSNE
jgi:hypothetical protein